MTATASADSRKRELVKPKRAQVTRDAESAPRTRDAQRSREAILAAAERQFAEHGFDGASLQEIASEAGLSRGAPSYFFGSKDSLYERVLERVFEERDDATRRAFAPVVAWTSRRGRTRRAQARARKSGRRLSAVPHRATVVRTSARLGSDQRRRAHTSWPCGGGGGARGQAMAEAFGAVRGVAKANDLARFAVDDAVLVTVALTFSLVSHQATLMSALGRALNDEDSIRRHTSWSSVSC